MRAFFELKKNKILHTTFTTYKPYSFLLSTSSAILASSELIYLFGSGSKIQSRSFFNSNFQYCTSSANFSGSIYLGNSLSSGSSLCISSTIGRKALLQLNNIYASSSFLKPSNYDNLNPLVANVQMDIPSILYGSEIKPGSFSLTTNGIDDSKYLVDDDGYGGVYLSGSDTHAGSIYYQHGIVILQANTAMLPEGLSIASGTVRFSGTYKTPMNMYIIDVPKGEANFSTNESYTQYDTGSTDYKLAIKNPKTYITAVGLYDEDYELVGVIKLATPFLHDENTSGQIRAKLVF